MTLRPNFSGFLFSACLQFSAIAALAWTIDGTVVNEAGSAIAGANITTYNYGGFTTTSDANGKFFLSNDEEESIGRVASQGKLSVTRDGFFLNIANPAGGTFKVSLMDALGKVQQQQEFHSQNATIDLKKFAGQKVMILKVTSGSANENYILSRGALMKADAPLAYLSFMAEGYAPLAYQMTAEVENNVIITMKEKSDVPASSSSSVKPPSSSSSRAAFSSSSEDEVVNCTGKAYPAGNHNMTINGRTYIMHVPSAYKGTEPVPLVVDYHGIGGSGAGQLSGTNFKNQTDPEGVITLYPDGSTQGWSGMGPGWNVGPCCSAQDDVQFTRDMVKQVKSTVCIDPKRIYATGFSMGGGMTNHLACNAADLFAAFAPAAMDLNTVNSASCNPARPASIILFRSKNDNVCIYNGGDSGRGDGLNFLGAEKNFEFWANKNGCTGSPTTNAQGCREYSNCKDGVKVVFCVNQYAGHTYADGSIAWPFVKQYTLP